MNPIRDEWTTEDGSIRLLLGDCLEILPTLADGSVDAVVTDPPYGLSFMGKRWDYDVPSAAVWAECLRVLKPGGHLLCFAGTRTQHRMAVRIEDAGFEIRDMIAWVYGSGFPKSLNVSAAIARLEVSSIERQFCEWIKNESGLTPGDMGTDRFHKCRVDIVNTATADRPRLARRSLVPTFSAWEQLRPRIKATIPAWVEECVKSPPSAPIEHPGQRKSGSGKGVSGVGPWSGWGTALKPSFEPVTVARKPLDGCTVAENVLTHGTGAINVDGCRVESNGDHMVKGVVTKRTTITGDERTGAALGMYGAGASFTPTNSPLGRWPANLIHDGSEEVVGLFPVTTSGTLNGNEYKNAPIRQFNAYGKQYPHQFMPRVGDSGSAARFFYCAKASKADRDEGCEGMEERASSSMPGRRSCDDVDWKADNDVTERFVTNRRNHHPTVKPTDLMRYLCRLVTPPGGVVLDPFAGSGSTGKGAVLEGFRFIGIEREAEYFEIAKARIAAKQKPLPLFAQTTFLEPAEAT